MKQIVLLQSGSAGGSFADPGDWNPFNSKIECLGKGGTGSTSVPAPPVGDLVPGGGGGGAYAVVYNVNLTFPVPYYVAEAGNVGLQDDPATNFGINYPAWLNAPAGRICGAQGGDFGQAMNGSSAGGFRFYPSGFKGGNGALEATALDSMAGGGGGAAGPSGPGGDAQSGGSMTVPGNGGSANGGATPGGTGGSANGLSGSEWGAYGCGSGGAGSSNSGTNGGAGGKYGGGGGGHSLAGGGGGGGVGGSATDGLIVLTYVELPKIYAVFTI